MDVTIQRYEEKKIGDNFYGRLIFI